jgi:hypothetical protein
MKEKEKIMKEFIKTQMEDAVVLAKAIQAEEDAEEAEETAVAAVEEETTVIFLKNGECFNCGKKGQYFTDCSLPRKNDNEQSNMVSKSDFKKLFKSSLNEMLTIKNKQAKKKENAEGDDESLDMNVFEKLMECKHTKIVNKINDDLISINDTNTFDYSI